MEQRGGSDALIANNQLSDAFYSLFYLPLGDIGVYAFVMITGYYLGSKEYDEKRTLRKAVSIYTQLYFYSILFFLVAIYLKMPLKENYSIWKSIMPLTFNHYWFVTAYILLMLFLPYINRAVANLSRSRFIYLLVILIASCSIFPLINNNVASESVGLGILITAYLVGLYIRKFVKKSNWNYLIGIVLFVVNLAIIYGKMYYDIVFSKNRYTNIYTGFFALICSLGLFLIFITFKAHFNGVINQVAKHMFAVYLITENIFVLTKMWNYFTFSNTTNLIKMNFYGFIAVLGIMTVCYFMDIGRSIIFKVISIILNRHKLNKREVPIKIN
ncbi:acyltransferase family protein [Companilactobacillus keshanensis]|uniref:Acyltransferase family protein n=1 Tax=Companilactobacillus keshanensis TaxID=2486003 RepID=A0ABW4BVZ3_9LACO|nr:acyltransferase family protein [Companilactobacillus keshanensis]